MRSVTVISSLNLLTTILIHLGQFIWPLGAMY
jgi:hypothetical protein